MCSHLIIIINLHPSTTEYHCAHRHEDKEYNANHDEDVTHSRDLDVDLLLGFRIAVPGILLDHLSPLGLSLTACLNQTV